LAESQRRAEEAEKAAQEAKEKLAEMEREKKMAEVRAAREAREQRIAEARAEREEQRRQAAEEKAQAEAAAKVYVVQPGDSLSKIAGELMGDATRWKEIWEANKDQIKDPNLIQIGQELRIP
jgi:nucleoid-associated protein YgaU